MAYNIVNPVQIVTNGNMASNITSAVMEIKYQDNVGIQLQWTGTPTGTFAFQVSLDYAKDAQGNVTNAGTWIAITTTPSVSASGAAGNAFVSISSLPSNYIRVVYTASSGTGTLNVYSLAKGA